MNRGKRWTSEAGETPVGLLLIAPVMMLILATIIGAGRLSEASMAVESAVAAAAREGTVAPDPVSAQANAQTTVAKLLSERGIHCPSHSVNLDATALHNGPGVEGRVVATIQCPVQLGDLLVPGLPGTVMIEREASSPIDSFRGQ